MTEKRFTTNGYKIYDTFHDGIHWLVNEVEAEEIVAKMNNLDTKARERGKHLSKLQKENEQLKQEKERYKRLSEIRNEQINNRILTIREFIDNCSNEDVKNALQDLFYSEVNEYDLAKENRILCSENERMINKLNELALEFLNHNMITMGKAVEISEMSYHDFLKYRKEKGNPMELTL